MLAGLLVTSLFIGMVSAESGDVALLVEETTPTEQPWYTPDSPLLLTPTLMNNGPDVSLTVNPSCPFVYNVYNATGVMLVNGSATCPVREQGLDLFAGEQVDFEAVEWSMKDNEGLWLESGVYNVELLHSSGLSSTVEATIQTPVVLPSELSYSVETTHRVDAEGPVVYMVNLHNPSDQSLDLTDLPACWLEIQVAENARLGADCFAGVNTLMPGEVILVEQFAALEHQAVDVATPGDDFVYTLSPQESGEAADVSFDMALALSGNQMPKFGPEDILTSQIVLTSPTPTVLDFTSSCKAEMWIVDDLGQTVFDTRDGKACVDIDLEMTVDDEPEILTLPQWNFYAANGCRVQSGTYTVIAELPEHGMVTTQHIEYTSMDINPCGDVNTADMDAGLSWLDETTVSVETSMSSEGQDYLRISQPCTFEVEFVNLDDEVVHRFQTLCDAYDGRKILLPSSTAPLRFDTLDISLVQDGTALLPDGQYTLELTAMSTTIATASMPLTWPQDFAETTTEEEPTQTVAEPFELTGSWTGLSTDGGTCFVLENEGDMYLLSNARTLSSWTPSAEMQGLYIVVETTPSPACSDFLAPSVEVVEVRMEQSLVADDGQEAAAPVEELAPVVEATPVVAVVSVVVTASLLSVLVVATATNEGLRLPATMAGLWFLGLLGKTHETTDGRYQRGRLMGYLTANPGCHFRALMNALNMSNGQITHHLRVLEAEEHVWRKSDGRLVRFYPLTNQLHPNTKEEDLPVPPLSPDPNSLQGKILNLLDEDGDMGQFPTQAELAKRLEKSQQLISHHLRTLQKYGLVERRKMGVKNRYKLTREAIFLLETSGDFAHEDAL